MRGKERFSAPGKVQLLIMRFSAGVTKIPALKPISRAIDIPLD